MRKLLGFVLVVGLALAAGAGSISGNSVGPGAGQANEFFGAQWTYSGGSYTVIDGMEVRQGGTGSGLTPLDTTGGAQRIANAVATVIDR